MIDLTPPTLQHPKLTKTSNYLSLILRHAPETIGLTLDDQGYGLIEDIIAKSKIPMSAELIDQIVKSDSKGRYEYSPCFTKIRAAQGHSLKTVNIDYNKQVPSITLYHGTVHRNLMQIKMVGLKSMNRTHVHLSEDVDTAKRVGQRHCKPVVLEIRAKDAWDAGYSFYLAENGVWLADEVPARFISVLGE